MRTLSEANNYLLSQIHPYLNKGLDITSIALKSKNKIWWICDKGKLLTHQWPAVIRNRTVLGTGCPFCANKIVTEENCLAAKFPSLSKEWHPTKNGKAKPHHYTPGSTYKAWWKGECGCEWQTGIAHRAGSKKTGCPNHKGIGFLYVKSIEHRFPHLVNEFDFEKNYPLTPDKISASRHIVLYWKNSQKYGCNHSWPQLLSNRTALGNDCHYCSGQKVLPQDSFAALFSELLKEWDYENNKNVDPCTLPPKSTSKKIHWKCKYGHKWTATAAKRAGGTNCPDCHPHTSKYEYRFLAELKTIFKKIEHRKLKYGKECDLYIPSLKFAIEIDGYIGHINKEEKDKAKNEILEKNGIFLLRIRDEKLKTKIRDFDITFNSRTFGLETIKAAVQFIYDKCDIGCLQKKQIEKYIVSNKLANHNEYLNMIKFIYDPLEGQSLREKHPRLDKYWHNKENGQLTTKNITSGSEHVVWWIGGIGCNHDYLQQISTRVTSVNDLCPECSKKAAGEKRKIKEKDILKRGSEMNWSFIKKEKNGDYQLKCNKGHLLNNRSRISILNYKGCLQCAVLKRSEARRANSLNKLKRKLAIENCEITKTEQKNNIFYYDIKCDKNHVKNRSRPSCNRRPYCLECNKGFKK